MAEEEAEMGRMGKRVSVECLELWKMGTWVAVGVEFGVEDEEKLLEMKMALEWEPEFEFEFEER